MIRNSFFKGMQVLIACIAISACDATNKDEAVSMNFASEADTSLPSMFNKTATLSLEQESSDNTHNNLPVPLYRLFNPYSGEHLYTQSQSEYLALGPIGWKQENISFYAFDNAVTVDSVKAVPWLRVFNPNSGLHHWTTDQNEYNTLGQLGWHQEDASGYIFDQQVTGSVPLYRLYNPNNGTHHWTMDSNERAVLIPLGWRDEGVAGYVFKSIADFKLKNVLTLAGNPISGVRFTSGNNTDLTTQNGVFSQDGTSDVTFKVAGLTIGTVSDANLPTSIEALVAANPSASPVIKNLPALLTELNAVGASNPIAGFRLYDLEQQLFKPASLPQNRVLGVNLETPQAEADGINQPLIMADIFRVARPFQEASCEDIVYNPTTGWPIEIPASCSQASTTTIESKYAYSQILRYSTSESIPEGTYTVLYDGVGAVHFSGMGCNRRFEDGVLLVDLDATKACPLSLDDSPSFNDNNARGLEVSITQIDPVDPIRNLRIVMPGGICKGSPFTRVENATACGSTPYISFVEVLKANRNAIVFNPDYLNFAKDFRVLRMMNLMEASPRQPSLSSHFLSPCPAKPAEVADDATPTEIDNYNTNLAAYNTCVIQPLTWAERPTIDDISWGGSFRTPIRDRQGIPLKVAIALANLLKADPWLIIPHNADDHYVSQYATLLADELDESLTAHVEYSNEVWNTGFWGHHYSTIKGEQDSDIAAMDNFPFRNADYSVRTRYYAKRATEIFIAFEAEFGDLSRLKRILGGQNKFHAIIPNLFSYGTTAEHTDAIAIAPYFHGCWAPTADNTNCGNVSKTLSEAITVDDIFEVTDSQYDSDSVISDHLRGDPDSLDGNIKLLARQKAELDLIQDSTGRKIDLYAYEGGQHLTIKGTDDAIKERLLPLIELANRDPRMKERYQTLLTGWKEAGGTLFTLFTAPQTFNRFGSFGIKEALNSLRADSPKYDGAMTFQEDLNGCWSGYVEDGC